jgi:two-component system OmpR family response regulator
MASTILVVDDDPHIREVVCFALENAGMKTISAGDGASAIELAQRARPDLIVLDVGLPEVDGLEVCRQVRKMSDQPILFLSSRAEEIDRILGIELGGDDYVTKPFSPRELVARVGAILRRSKAGVSANGGALIRHGALTIDEARVAVDYAGREVPLTALEFAVLKAIASAPGVVFDRKRIVASAYPPNIHVSDRTIDSHIRNIRAKLAAVGGENVIETVHGVGFRCRALAP